MPKRAARASASASVSPSWTTVKTGTPGSIDCVGCGALGPQAATRPMTAAETKISFGVLAMSRECGQSRNHARMSRSRLDSSSDRSPEDIGDCKGSGKADEQADAE